MGQQLVSEITLSRIWQEGLVARELRTTDGRRASVVYGGVWTHANGPDFRGALIDLDGRLVSGAVELHLRASDWLRHRHGSEPAYDEVILHVVLEDDLGSPVVTASGAAVPTVALAAFLSAPLDVLAGQVSARYLGDLGARTCLPTLAGGREDLVRGVLRRAGWKRLVAKQLRFRQALEQLPAGEVLYRGLLDGLGLTHNREGMAAVGEAAPLAVVESVVRRHQRAATAVLLGVAGLLPLSPAHASLAELSPAAVAELEQRYRELRDELRLAEVRDGIWALNRVRPQNHPVRRLASLGALIAQAGSRGLLATFLGLPLDATDPWQGWLRGPTPAIGASRCAQIAVNVLAPFLAAYAEATGDEDLWERCARVWEKLPGAADDAVARGTLRQIAGDRRFAVRLALESQGLHEIGRHGCAALRCFECPIALLALEHEPPEEGRLSVVRDDGFTAHVEP